jgi:drug/metabolite transporter (DMT)-like permease
MEVALGRYIFFGLLSIFIFFLKGSPRYPLSIWIKAIGFSFAATFGYYLFVILSMRYASASICALISGISPITIAFYGNWKEKEMSFKKLIIPSLLIFAGLVVVNVPHVHDNPSSALYLLGLLLSFFALLVWTWYVEANSRFLKKNPTISSSDWPTLIGVSSLFWVAIFGGIFFLFFAEDFSIARYTGTDLKQFLIGSAILGILCSWVGAFLWNKASIQLPMTLTGQLMTFETLFGLLFVYMLHQSLPPLMEVLGIGLFLTAIMYGIRASAQTTTRLAGLKNTNDTH